MKLLLIFIVLLTTLIATAQKKPLFRIIENNKVGYMNADGNVIIAPVYNSGSDFKGGMAAVRKDALYGFINSEGVFILPPIYDLADPFFNNYEYTYVVLNGENKFINKKGENIINREFKGFYYINNETGMLYTPDSINVIYDLKHKKSLSELKNTNAGPFSNGVSTAYTTKGIPYVINLKGDHIVPTGKYDDINDYYNGIAIAVKKNGDGGSSYLSAIDTKGNELFTHNYDRMFIDGDTHFSNGFAPLSFRKKEGEYDYFTSYINTKGKVVFNDTTVTEATNFSNNRAFILIKSKYMLIDTNFKKVTETSFSKVPKGGFTNGYAVVENDYSIGVIDINGKYIIEPLADASDGVIIGDYFFYGKYINDEDVYGVISLKGNEILKPILQHYDSEGFVNGLLQTTVNNKLTYYNTKGSMIWQQKDAAASGPHTLNIDYMNRGYFYAYSNETEEKYNGWGRSRNYPKTITPDKNFTPNTLSVSIDTTQPKIFRDIYAGYNLYITNTTGADITFSAQDSRLYVTLQAMDANGIWKNIEYTPNSWCGNSYHTVTLPVNSYWEFTIPKYEGYFKTKIRAVLKTKSGKNNDPEIFSNSIDASVNPAQFFNKNRYTASSLMDPYFE